MSADTDVWSLVSGPDYGMFGLLCDIFSRPDYSQSSQLQINDPDGQLFHLIMQPARMGDGLTSSVSYRCVTSRGLPEWREVNGEWPLL